MWMTVSNGCMTKSNGYMTVSKGCIRKSNGYMMVSKGCIMKSNGYMMVSNGCIMHTLSHVYKSLLLAQRRIPNKDKKIIPISMMSETSTSEQCKTIKVNNK